MIATTEAGVDTWGLAWYLDEDLPAFRAAGALATEPSVRAKRFKEDVAGHRVFFSQGYRLLYCEGHPKDGGLALSGDLWSAYEGLIDGLAAVGVKLDKRHAGRRVGDARLPASADQWEGFGGVRRIDTTVDLKFEEGANGLRALAGVAALPLPRTKTETIRQAGGSHVETVTFRGHAGRQILGRWYDKGIESGMAARGERVRPEAQRRYAKAHRPSIDAVADARVLRTMFARRFVPLYEASQGVTVGGPSELARKLKRLQREGVLTPGQAKAVAGHLLLESVDAHDQSRAQVYRDRALARRHGLVLADGLHEEGSVDLGEVLEAAMDSEPWGTDW